MQPRHLAPIPHVVVRPSDGDVPEGLREVAAYLQGIAEAVQSLHPSAAPDEACWADDRPSGTRLRLASLPGDLFRLTGT